MIDFLDEVKQKLEPKDVFALRQIGREVGVKHPTNKTRDVLIGMILDIATGKADPVQPSKKGAPPKSKEYDKSAVAAVMNCREYYLGGQKPDYEGYYNLGSIPMADGEKVYTGILELSDKYWFLRTDNMQISSMDDVFVHYSYVQRYHLRVGDKIICKAKRRKDGECPGLTYVISVNGNKPDIPRNTPFENLTPCYPDKRIVLEHDCCSITDRVIDLFSPIGFGQRALIVSPPKAGKTTMLKNIATSIRLNYPDVLTIILLVDERPEEVTDISRSVEGAEVIYSTFDKGDVHHTHTAALTIEYAKRQVEDGKDVVVLLDSITRLTRAYNALSNSGRTLSGGLDPLALAEPKRFFGAARNVENGGSLTIIATALVDTGSKLDDIIYEEFKSTGNMEITLSRALAERRIFPAIDVRASGARKEELLLTQEELDAASIIRGMLTKTFTEEDLFSSMKKTVNNFDFCKKSQTFLKHYNGR